MNSYDVLYLVVGTLSLIGSLSIMVLFIWKKELRTENFNRVFWMSFCDFGLSLKFWVSAVVGHPLSKGSGLCALSGITGNFFSIATATWYFIIAVNIYRVFQGLSKASFLSRYQHHVVWSISLVVGFLPWSLDDYGPIDDGDQCWITGNTDLMRLTFTVPLYVYLVFSIYLLGYVMLHGAVLTTRLRRRMVAFVLVFSGAWIWTIIANTWAFFSESIPDVLYYADLTGVIASGFLNFLVWFSSPAFLQVVCATNVYVDTQVGPPSKSSRLLGDIQSIQQQPSLETRVDKDNSSDIFSPANSGQSVSLATPIVQTSPSNAKINKSFRLNTNSDVSDQGLTHRPHSYPEGIDPNHDDYDTAPSQGEEAEDWW